MAGDLAIPENVIFDQARAATSGRSLHQYGRIRIIPEAETAGLELAAEESLTETEQLGLAAFRLRESAEYQEAKQNRPRDGETWDMPSCATVVPGPRASELRAEAAAPTSSYLEGPVAVGIVIVQGPTPALRFSDAEVVK